jgi:translocation and assembly module TamA
VVGLAAPALAQASRVTIEGQPGELTDQLRDLLPTEEAPASLFEAQRQADRAAAIVAKLLESEGWYAAEVDAEAGGVETFTRVVRVLPGDRFTFAATKIVFPDGAPDADTQRALENILSPIVEGEPARAQPVLLAGDSLLTRLRSSGYPDARQEPVDALADGRAHTIELTFSLHPGRRASFGDVVISGNDRTRLDFLEQMVPWSPGDLFSPGKLDEYRTRLSRTDLFASAAVRLDPPAGQPSEPTGDPLYLGPRNVLVDLKERDRRTLALGASASTSEGVGGDAEWEIRNLTGRGDSLTTHLQIATLERRLETIWRKPNIGGRYDRNLRLGAKIENFETDAFDQLGGSLSATIDEQLTPRVRGSVGVEGGYASIADSRTRLLRSDRRNIYFVRGDASADYVGVRDILDPHNGIRARLSVSPGATAGDTTILYTRISGEGSVYVDLGSERTSFAARGRLGAIVGPNGAPPDQLFFAGGGGSVRGYDYQSLSPRDIANVPIGGRSLVETSLELRYRVSERFGAVAFLDAGAAGDDINPPLSDMRVGAGLGLRYYAGFGPLRFDIAAPLDKRKGDSDFQIYISIGQAF